MLKKTLQALFGMTTSDDLSKTKTSLLETLVEEVLPNNNFNTAKQRMESSERFHKLTQQEGAEQLAVAFQVVGHLSKPQSADYRVRMVYRDLLLVLVRFHLPVPFSDLLRLIHRFQRLSYQGQNFPIYSSLFKRVKRELTEELWNEKVEARLKSLRIVYAHDYYPLNARERNFNQEVDQLIARYRGNFFVLQHDILGQSVEKAIQEYDDQQTEWEQLIFHLAKPVKGSKPTKAWWASTQKLLQPFSEDQYLQLFTSWVIKAEEQYRSFVTSRNLQNKSDRNEHFIRALVWAAGFLNHAPLTDAVEALGLICFKKIPGYGQGSTKLGNACLWVFATLPYEIGIAKLTNYRSKVKYPSTRKLIERRITEVAEREGKTRDQIEEMGVPTLGLGQDHHLIKRVGDYSFVLEIEGLQKFKTYWLKPDGKTQKSVPASIKETHKKEITQLRNTTKALKQMLPAQRDRIERCFLAQRTWRYEEWFALYITHPLIGYLGKRLIWFFKKGEQTTTAIYCDNQWMDNHGKTIDWLDARTEVQLWHPIGFSAAYVLKWREWLLEHELQQPIKQAYREIYILTEAEINTGNYSNRFAAHILRQHQFSSLCQIRGWHYTLQGNWDSHNIPCRILPNWDISVQFLVDANYHGATSGSGIFEYVFTDQVQFYKGRERMELHEVPALVFSEMMREVDLFVGVASIGTDSEWQDRGDERFYHYWRRFSDLDLSENAKTRKATLEQLIPRLKIADRCSFTDKQLVVKGKLRTYYIHMGSGNIHMSPNNQYLCIVPGREQKVGPGKIFLPFEGDQLLSIILSKAFLLAEDDKIEDSSIVSQIRSR